MSTASSERIDAARAHAARHPNYEQRKVTVCAECLTASCWHGEFMCADSRYADIVEKTVSELRLLDLEHSDNWLPGRGIDW